MFINIEFNNDRPIYLQIKDYIKELIIKGFLHKDEKLPSTRELADMLKVSRNTIMEAYKYLDDEGFIYTLKGRGVYVADVEIRRVEEKYSIDFDNKISKMGRLSAQLDIVKHEAVWKKGMISFKTISPDNSLFDLEEFKKSFLNRMAIEGEKILSYGYAQGYKPLIEYLRRYMENKGVDTSGKDIIITNGFTEGLDLTLTALTEEGDKIVCENPTHNTAIKIMKLHGLEIIGVKMNDDGIDIYELKKAMEKKPKLGFLIPSYHNPTGIVMTPEKRVDVYKVFQDYKVPIIEDGFNEELRYSGSHVAPIMALCGAGNSVIYIGSLSKVLFPGIRIGWVLCDKKLSSYLESIKRSKNIHTSFLDQAVLHDYLLGGNFEKYLKKVRRVYKEKYEWAMDCAKKYIPCNRILGAGGLHIFIELDGVKARDVLEACYEKGVIFMPGDIFYTDGGGENTLRLGFSRVSFEEINKGFKIIGDVIKKLEVE